MPAVSIADGAVGFVGRKKKKAAAPEKAELSTAPGKVDVKPVARDEEISNRLELVLTATGWFIDPKVRVEEGVVFLSGQVDSEELKKWAGDLARNTQDVVAVANRMEILEPSMWDFSDSWQGLLGLWRDCVRSLPFLLLGLLILGLSASAGVMTTRGARSVLRHKIRANLLRDVIARAIGFLVLMFGAYIILRVSGLTQLALTVVGGTGLIGLAFGVAFRDITENFQASIFLSMQRLFEPGDLVEITGVTGYVQQLNVRTTIMMTLEGNLVQIPNATVYKANLRNFTTNANRREDFVVGIGYDDSINEAQEVARRVLLDHPAVLQDPEPSVLVESLGSSTVNLRVYFWLNGREHSVLKVRSSVIRLIKRAFQEQGVSMPDDAREIIFPHGVRVSMSEGKQERNNSAPPARQLPVRPSDKVIDAKAKNATMNASASASTSAEGGLQSEAGVIQEQARHVQPLHDGEDLLDGPSGSPDVAAKGKKQGGNGGDVDQ